MPSRLLLSLFSCVLAASLAPGAAAQDLGKLEVEIHQPAPDTQLPELQPSIEVEGGASIFGGVKQLDLLFVLDSSKSLQRTDRGDYRTRGAIGLVKTLPARTDIQMGVVDVDGNAELLTPLTRDRRAVVAGLRELDQIGGTDLADGIRTALDAFEERARPGSSRVILLFTDGKSDEDEAREAMQVAKRRGVAIHTLLLGKDANGERMLRDIAEGTGASFLRVSDPAKLPQAFLNLRTTGIEQVTLSANGSAPVPAKLVGGTFQGRVPIQQGENLIVAEATALDGRKRSAQVRVMVSGPLAVKIETPLDGTVYAQREGEALVEGSASVFAGISSTQTSEGVDHGISGVVLRVGDSPPFATTFENGRFRGRVMLESGENRIVATATARDGRVADSAISVNVKASGCAELELTALRDGRPALSISDRAVEIVLDASGSMWGQIGGRSKMDIAKQTLEEALASLPAELLVALRVYGHQYSREQRNCTDSQLLVSFGPNNRGQIRQAISSFRPSGQTPLGYSLEQVAGDFGGFSGERAVVLLTDGIESCNGDPVGAARALQRQGGAPVHVISFGFGGDQDTGSLRAIAEASGGRFLTARDARELRDALSVTVGTAYRVSRDGLTVARGTLGAGQRMHLPEGDYSVHLDSRPPRELPVSLVAEERLDLVIERRGDKLGKRTRRVPTEYVACDGGAPAPTGLESWDSSPAAFDPLR